MGLFDLFKSPSPESQAQQAANAERLADITRYVQAGAGGAIPASIQVRLDGARNGTMPWTATLTPAELLIVRSHGLRPIASVSATCWMHYGWSWTLGHRQGWEAALCRLRDEARAAGANAVLDVKMRTLPLYVANSMDFTLFGTAVSVEGLPPSQEPVVATVPALEFVKLLEADVVPTGIAIGAHYEWLAGYQASSARQTWMGNTESKVLSQLWETVRQRAHAELRRSAAAQGNGVLAHVNFGQMLEVENKDPARRYLARQIVIATTVDARRGGRFPHEITMAVDMHAGATPLTGTRPHHRSYASNEREGGI